MGSDLTGEGGAAAYSGLEVVAGDDEDGGAASVAEGTAATAVLGVGEEDGKVRHGVRDPLVGLAGGGVVGDERREAAAFGTPVRTRHVGASSPVVPKGKEKSNGCSSTRAILW